MRGGVIHGLANVGPASGYQRTEVTGSTFSSRWMVMFRCWLRVARSRQQLFVETPGSSCSVSGRGVAMESSPILSRE